MLLGQISTFLAVIGPSCVLILVKVHGLLGFALAKEMLELLVLLVEEVEGKSIGDGLGGQKQVYGQVVGDGDSNMDLGVGVDPEGTVVVVVLEQVEEEVVRGRHQGFESEREILIVESQFEEAVFGSRNQQEAKYTGLGFQFDLEEEIIGIASELSRT